VGHADGNEVDIGHPFRQLAKELRVLARIESAQRDTYRIGGLLEWTLGHIDGLGENTGGFRQAVEGARLVAQECCLYINAASTSNCAPDQRAVLVEAL